MLVLIWMLMIGAAAGDEVVVAGDDVAITSSRTVRVGAPVIADANDDGVVWIKGRDMIVDFAGATLNGAAPGDAPDEFRGLGVHVTGSNITVRNLNVRGYKVGIHAINAPGLVLEDCDVSGNYRQRLQSTAQAEHPGDWLWPHLNDENQWVRKYGAGVVVEDSGRVTIRRVRCRDGQNGIVLDRVKQSKVYDNDCSFLSGWGLAMWRSGGNVITRNAFDFCIRGYSHGVYNRGQDSAGILMFEQCNDNLIAENSATHGGDGLFGFGGEAALASSERLGNNNNLIINNDFSFAAAHGIEMTFSFSNRFVGNLLESNAICGLWGGYSQASAIMNNRFIRNGEMAYGLERGGVNIEHGHGNVIAGNLFQNNTCGVHLWWDNDEAILAKPWAEANEKGSSGNTIVGNRFVGDELAIQLRATTDTVLGENQFENVAAEMEIDGGSTTRTMTGDMPLEIDTQYEAIGANQPVGARHALRGREKIIMTQWGPYDWRSPLLQRASADAARHEYRLLGEGLTLLPGDVAVDGDVTVSVKGQTIRVVAKEKARLSPYSLRVNADGQALEASGVLLDAHWDVTFFQWRTDPRKDESAWRAEAEQGVSFRSRSIDFRFGGGGPSQLEHVSESVREARLPTDFFGTFATTTITIPPGRWKFETVSDDGVRVLLNGQSVIENWTHHAPTRDAHIFETGEPITAELRIEHFELFGHAELALSIEQAIQ